MSELPPTEAEQPFYENARLVPTVDEARIVSAQAPHLGDGKQQDAHQVDSVIENVVGKEEYGDEKHGGTGLDADKKKSWYGKWF